MFGSVCKCQLVQQRLVTAVHLMQSYACLPKKYEPMPCVLPSNMPVSPVSCSYSVPQSCHLKVLGGGLVGLFMHNAVLYSLSVRMYGCPVCMSCCPVQSDCAGLPIRVETGPHYLGFADTDIADGNTLLKCMPPIRDKANQQGLLQGLKVLATSPTAIYVMLAVQMCS